MHIKSLIESFKANSISTVWVFLRCYFSFLQGRLVDLSQHRSPLVLKPEPKSSLQMLFVVVLGWVVVLDLVEALVNLTEEYMLQLALQHRDWSKKEHKQPCLN